MSATPDPTTTASTTAAASSAPSFDQVVAAIHTPTPTTATATTTHHVTPPSQKKRMLTLIAGILLLTLLGIGGWIAYNQVGKSQEIRQQASTGSNAPGCATACITKNDCPANFSCTAGKCDAAVCHPGGKTACVLSFNVAPTAIVCQKTAYRDEFSNTAGNYNLIQQQSAFKPGDIIVFNINLTNNGSTTVNIGATDVLTGNNLDNVTFLDSNCVGGSYDPTSKTLTCPAVSVGAGQSVARTFRVKVNANVADGTVITNGVTATSTSTSVTCSVPVTVSNASPSPSPSPSPTPTPTPTTYSCNGPCSNDSQCQSVNTSYVCYYGSCRLNSNVSSTTCTPPAPLATCNQSCSTNADCAYSNYICFDTGAGKYCRLDSYPTSTTCQPPAPVTYYTPAPVYSAPPYSAPPQPVKPQKLPVSGSKDSIKFVLGGAGAVILGGAALLLL